MEELTAAKDEAVRTVGRSRGLQLRVACAGQQNPFSSSFIHLSPRPKGAFVPA